MLLRFLAILALIYLVSRVLRNFFTRPFQEGYQDKAEQNEKAAHKKREGRVSVKTNGAGKAKDNKSIGEYIDYEEVEDEDSK